MVSRLEAPSFESLVAEQEIVQAEKFQGRLRAEYSEYILPTHFGGKPHPSAVKDFLEPFCAGEGASLDGLIRGLCEANGDIPFRWVEMGGGRSLPMRQWATDVEISGRLSMTNVDLFDFGLDGLEPYEMEYLETLNPGMTSGAAAPRFIRADAETVILPEPADLITSIEAIQYLNNPLAAIANWYNQLADDGLLIISAGGNLASWIRYEHVPGRGDPDETPTKHLLETLEAAGVPFAASYEADWPNGVRPSDPSRFRTLVIQKRPGTQLLVHSAVTEVWVNPHKYKAVYYEAPAANSKPIVEVVAA